MTENERRRDAIIGRLRAAGCVYAEDEADLLLAETAGSAAADVTARAAETAGEGSAAEPDDLEARVARRIAGEPLEQIVGWAEFAGRRFAVAPGVFVPRARTELLAREAAVRCRPGEIFVDLCCGVGAVAGYVTDRVPGLAAYAVEIDPVAADCARRNLGDAAWIGCGDLFAPLPESLHGRVAVIAANAPYVPTSEIAFMPTEARDHEAATALDGGDDGLELHRRIVAEVAEWLAPGGSLLIETGRGQAETDLELLRAAGLVPELITDDEISGTVVVGEFAGRPGRLP